MNDKKIVRYQWSEDGEVELCVREDGIADSPGLCYHCDNFIPVGSEVSVLRPADGGYYRMHKECADKGCTMAMAEKPIDYKQLYAIARAIPAGVALRLAREAGTEEERCFWIRIHDMNLQRAQKLAIDNNLF